VGERPSRSATAASGRSDGARRAAHHKRVRRWRGRDGGQSALFVRGAHPRRGRLGDGCRANRRPQAPPSKTPHAHTRARTGMHTGAPPPACRRSHAGSAAYWRWKHRDRAHARMGLKWVRVQSHLGCQAPRRQPGMHAPSRAQDRLATDRVVQKSLGSRQTYSIHVPYAWSQAMGEHACAVVACFSASALLAPCSTPVALHAAIYREFKKVHLALTRGQ